MAQTLLVGPEIETGRKILQALDNAKLKISVAMWAVLSSYGDWRLVLSSSRLDAKGTQQYGHVVPWLGPMLAKFPDADVFVLSEYTFTGPVPDRIKAWCRKNRKYLVVGGEDPAAGPGLLQHGVCGGHQRRHCL